MDSKAIKLRIYFLKDACNGAHTVTPAMGSNAGLALGIVADAGRIIREMRVLTSGGELLEYPDLQDGKQTKKGPFSGP
nr:hypothetical protein [uncultured Dyadobacter sp.]